MKTRSICLVIALLAIVSMAQSKEITDIYSNIGSSDVTVRGDVAGDQLRLDRRRVMICLRAMDVSKYPIILDYPQFIGIFLTLSLGFISYCQVIAFLGDRLRCVTAIILFWSPVSNLSSGLWSSIESSMESYRERCKKATFVLHM